MIIDMHCHLDLYPDPADIIKKCSEYEAYVLSVTTTPKAWEGTNKLAQGYERIKTALGLHPHLAHQRSNEIELFDALLPKTKYIGEIGLDAGKNFKETWDIQLKVFRHILNSVNNAGGRIMSIHSTASASAVIDELSGIDGIPVFHWFNGSLTQLKRAISRDYWFSVGPAMLKSKSGKNLVSMMPKDRVLTESDGPFAKYNNASLYPWNYEITIRELASVWQMPHHEVDEQVKRNFKELIACNNAIFD